MKVRANKFMLTLLVTAFTASALLCCCLTDTVQAQEPVPSCHQTEEHSQSSDSKQDCDCQPSIVLLQKNIQLDQSLVQIAVLSISLDPIDFYPIVMDTLASASPPEFQDTSPLYIKHSILRI